MTSTAKTAERQVNVAPSAAPPRSWHDMAAKLRQAGLRPTRQRVALSLMLFANGARHLSAEMLYQEASQAKVPVSLATVYNTLHQFTEAGFLRQIAVDGSKTYFDTNTTEHHHFLVEGAGELFDIPGRSIRLESMPDVPEGYEILSIDVVVRLRRKPASSRCAPRWMPEI